MPALSGHDDRMEANPFIIDHESDDGRPFHSDKLPLSSDSDSDVDDSALDREFLEKDSRFLDEPSMEEGHGYEARGDEEQEGYAYPTTSKRSRTRQPKMFIFGLLCILLGATAIGILAGTAFQGSHTMYTRKGGSKHLTMDHIFNGTFNPHLENVAWVKEGESLCDSEDER
jgi:dipeptidyl aminopeptidase